MYKKFFNKDAPAEPQPDKAVSRRRPKLRLAWNSVSFWLWFIGIGLIMIWWFWELPVISPLTSTSTFRFLTGMAPPPANNRVVYGFLPYWNLKDVTLQPELTHLSYFSLTLGSDGTLLTKNSDGTTEPGFRNMQSDVLLDLVNQLGAGQQLDLTITQFNNDDIVAFLASPTAQETFLESLDSVILSLPIRGINIDIEYSGEVTPTVQTRLVSFMTLLNQHLDQRYKHIQLSIDVYASAAKEGSFWKIGEIAPQVDFIVVMAYDFHRRSSPQAGPVAPLFGGKEMWDSDISQNLKLILETVPAEKILLGIPFYGYEWQTTSREAQAHTFPDTGSTASYKRVQEIVAKRDQLAVQEHWNEQALSPYISYKEDGNMYVIYYENSRSISYKLDLVNQLNLGGIAIWALGYEGNSRELWDVIQRKVSDPSAIQSPANTQ